MTASQTTLEPRGPQQAAGLSAFTGATLGLLAALT
jgi:hypothetical protein